MQPADICSTVDAAMAAANITRNTARAVPEGRFSPFRISPEPFAVDRVTADALTALGSWLRDFYHAADQLYRLSLEHEIAPFLARYLDAGKPPWLVKLGQAEGFRGQIPVIIRPDLLFTAAGMRATELDSVPGSMGLLAFLEETYAGFGFHLLGEQPTGAAFLHALRSLPGSDGITVIVISDECSGYRSETGWLTEQWRATDASAPLVVTPEQLRYDARGVWLNEQRVGRVYRFFELFDWENVPGAHRLLHLAATEKVALTPPPKPHLEEKMWFAFLHRADLLPYWRELLPADALAGLQSLFPPTWLLAADQPPPSFGACNSWQQVRQSSRRERPFVLKPSGFSPLAWGGHGFSRGKDYTTRLWAETIERLLAQADQSPYVLQAYQHSLPQEVSFYDADKGKLQQFVGKTRLCPYYFLLQPSQPEEKKAEVVFSGALATTVPISKPVIHGMTDAVMSPTGLSPVCP